MSLLRVSVFCLAILFFPASHADNCVDGLEACATSADDATYLMVTCLIYKNTNEYLNCLERVLGSAGQCYRAKVACENESYNSIANAVKELYSKGPRSKKLHPWDK